MKDEEMIPYKCMVDDLKKYFSHVTFQKIPWVDKKVDNAMATLASML